MSAMQTQIESVMHAEQKADAETLQRRIIITRQYLADLEESYADATGGGTVPTITVDPAGAVCGLGADQAFLSDEEIAALHIEPEEFDADPLDPPGIDDIDQRRADEEPA